MITVRDFTFTISNDLKIDLKYRDRIVYTNHIESIIPCSTNKNFYRIETPNQGGFYYGFILDKNGKKINKLSDVKKIK